MQVQSLSSAKNCMHANPFTPDGALLQTALSAEMYQRIHALALYRAIQGDTIATIPQCLQIERLRYHMAAKGPDVCLKHPADLALLFTNVTFAVYRSIETLYCSRVGRNIFSVWHILAAMAEASQVQPIAYEAVWAICIYLEVQRQAHVTNNFERGQECWCVGKVRLDLVLQEAGGGAQSSPSLLLVADLRHQRVLSMRILFEEPGEQDVSLLLYDAFCTQRRPHPRAIAGVLLHLPKHILTERALSPRGQAACRQLGIAVELSSKPQPFVEKLQTIVASVLTRRVLSVRQCLLLLDRYLNQTCGYGPLSTQFQRDQQYAHLAGYPQEPTWLFPLLRSFLPDLPATITDEGSIEHDDLHYSDDLLRYFPGCMVTIRPLVSMEAGIWVYLDDAVLCQAWAHELRRRDGTYRPSRPRR